jgi:hypothetical protein
MTRTEFIKMVAGLETLDEYDKRTDGDGMPCDDAIETLSQLIEAARTLENEFPPHLELTRCDQARETLFNLPHNARRMERNGKERVYHAALVELHKSMSPVQA